MQCAILIFVIPLFLLFLGKKNYTDARSLIGSNVYPVNNNKYPSAVCIVTIANASHPVSSLFQDSIECTGVLISYTHVLIAEHCSYEMNDEKIQVIIGSADVRLGRRHDVMWWITYKKWATQKNQILKYKINDMSAIKLVEPAHSEGTFKVRPAKLTRKKKKKYFGLNAIMVGWGQLSNGLMPLQLHAGEVTILPDSECELVFIKFGKNITSFSKSEFCSMNQPYILLECGDSGGPIYIDDVVVGINIGTIPYIQENTFNPDQANLHASIYYYRHFIDDMKNM